MTHFLHFYPYRVDQSEGGTLRLETARRATELLGPTEVQCFDRTRGEWEPIASVRHDRTDGAASASQLSRVKRIVFPHTLFESGRHPVHALAPKLQSLDQATIPVLHTSYLAPALTRLPRRRAVVDVYDLVWYAHHLEARRRSPHTPIRAAYAASVKVRENRVLSRALCLPVAGWADWKQLSPLGPPTAWCPTGLRAGHVVREESGTHLRIGFLGNFAHQATVDSALALLRSPAASCEAVEVILGGWQSNTRNELRGRGARLVGPVKRPEDFWRDIDVAVIPVDSGSGIKCKIAEAMLAGRGVVTTPLGAAGFDEVVREKLTVVSRVDRIDVDVCRRTRPVEPEVARRFAMDEAAGTYAAFLRAALEGAE
jgi:hypothetical protein